ncbi:MAG: hypothetical protein RBT75_13690 [Anaerolineae bacterium]|jgi:hypothetical protein|nr:hypothetical protein [Anaerolineae bacterium]
MSEKTLLLVEASGIQDYIFGSNQLAQNIGASELVRRATEDWVETLTTPEQRVYTGGGNAMLLFDTEPEAEDLARQLTRRVLEEAPGLHLLVARQRFKEGELRQTHQQLREKLAQRKLEHRPSTPLLGLGVTAACVYTGAPAVAVQDGQLISAEVQAKLGATEDGKIRLRQQLRQIKKDYEFVYDFNDFGTKGESSYLTVIHTDGNRMGERIQALAGATDETYAEALKAFSDSVRTAAGIALNSTVNLLLQNIVEVEGEDGKIREAIAGRVPCPEKGGIIHLPFRPIVFGGDDVTFVCEGRLGLALAAHYLRVFSAQSLSDKELAHARAGVAVVKSHYPFSRAYELAEDLAASAKRYISETKLRFTALDWHFAVGGLVLPLSEIREREYTVSAGKLLMRPLSLTPITNDGRSWDTFTSIMAEFNGDMWADKRNKIKALREALREGPQSVERFLALYTDRTPLPEIKALPSMAKQGWQGSRCGYFDAIEALDFFIPLEEGNAS